MATNLVSYFVDSDLVAVREPQVPLADWDGGMNPAASCAPGIGINTGDYDPKESDWPRILPSVLAESQFIGEGPSAIFVKDPTFGDNSLVSFVQSTAPVAPNGTVATVSGFPMVNRTGKTVPSGSWVWAVGNN